MHETQIGASVADTDDISAVGDAPSETDSGQTSTADRRQRGPMPMYGRTKSG